VATQIPAETLIVDDGKLLLRYLRSWAWWANQAPSGIVPGSMIAPFA
jgi:hypothetical protein